MSSLGPRGLLRSPQRNKRGAGGSSFRDLDLHPDFVPSPAAVGPMARAKRQLQSAGLEDPSAKLRRLKTTAEAKAAEVYEAAPSARELRAATREVVRERAQTLHGVACTVVEAANEELTILADEVAAAGSTAQAHAVSAVQGLHAHSVATQQMVEAKIEAVKEQAVTAAKATLWGAMSYLKPRVDWSMQGYLGWSAAPQPKPAAPKAKPAVATLSLVSEVNMNPKQQVFAA